MSAEDESPTPTPLDVPSPQRSSLKALSFAEQCDHHAERLVLSIDPDAQVLAGELMALGAHLRTWETVPPAEDDRSQTTDLFWALMTRAHAHK